MLWGQGAGPICVLAGRRLSHIGFNHREAETCITGHWRARSREDEPRTVWRESVWMGVPWHGALAVVSLFSSLNPEEVPMGMEASDREDGNLMAKVKRFTKESVLFFRGHW